MTDRESLEEDLRAWTASAAMCSAAALCVDLSGIRPSGPAIGAPEVPETELDIVSLFEAIRALGLRGYAWSSPGYAFHPVEYRTAFGHSALAAAAAEAVFVGTPFPGRIGSPPPERPDVATFLEHVARTIDPDRVATGRKPRDARRTPRWKDAKP